MSGLRCDPTTLHLEEALQLLQGAGLMPSSDLADGSAAWLQGVIDGLCSLSSRDALTGLANRRSLLLALDREIDRVARSGEPALLLMIDIDHFKRVNDQHGHGAGDQVLATVGRALADCFRPMDTLARIGGEEFAAVLPNCPPAFGQGIGERIRARIERCAIEIAPQREIRVSVSVGGAFAPPWVRSSPKWWFERADRQLYRAKSEGRNRACLEPAPHTHVSSEEKGLLFATSPAPLRHV